MKKATKMYLLLVPMLICGYSQSIAQDEENRVFHVQTFYIGFVEGASVSEFDSLTSLLMENVTSKSKYLLSQRMMNHLWGSDNRQFIIIREYASMEDLVAANEQSTDDLFNSYWDTEEKREAFNEAYRKYFRGSHHSDEIYSEIKGGRK